MMWILESLTTSSPECLPLAAATPLVGLYIVCLVVGGGLLFISTIFGGDADVDADVDLDVDVSADVDADVDLDASDGHTLASSMALSTWFSISFLIYFAACFGVVGTVLTYMSSISAGVVLGASVLSGLVVGQGVHHLMRRVKSAEAVPPASPRDYSNKTARVTIAVASGQLGEVAVMVRGRERFVAARPKHDQDRFEVKDRVVVVAFNNGTADVVSEQEYEFVTDSKPEDSNELEFTDRTN